MIIMQKILASLICTLALLAFLMPATVADSSQNATANITINATQNATAKITQNETQNDDSLKSTPTATQMGEGNAASHTKVLRAGFEKTKPLNNLDVYGNKSTYNIPSSTSPSLAFNVSQRLGNVSKITYNTDIYKPIYNISQYSRTKPIYEVPDTLSSKPVYSISGYPEIKAVNSIP
jgi:hypothetical protein